MNLDLHIPTRVVFGRGRLAELGELVRPLGRHALIVCGRTAMRRNGTLEFCVKALAGAGVETTVFDGVSPDPLAAEVDRAVALALAGGCDVIVGLGGGSALDAAKAASVGLAAGPVGPLVGTTLGPLDGNVPVVAVPTTAGSGAEVTKGAIITDAERGLKSGIRGESLFPAIALIDPDLALSVPAPVAAAAGFDALAHAVEGYVARRGNTFTRALALQAVDLLGRRLPEVTAGRGDATAREDLAYAALLGGMNVAVASTCLPHRLQQAMGAVPRVSVSHGQGLAAVYPAWLETAVPHAEGRFLTVCAPLGRAQADPADAIGLFLAEIGAAGSLSARGFTAGDIPELLAAVTGNTENDPVPDITAETVRSVYERSL
jgi:alcohol dehydrogenase